ncbi:DUF616 domain-containing protein [Butyrivibrio sp. X503]|uniref:glycosyltransferase domain-containing protein n=1 Tax=Butyrivibrio sp. X503 TaxID=2364878 RepID=UPI000EA94016|nr:glycosyltransferase domain-containing protein [Butyrivibrio sp. X503]RKM54340.1 DUF616 domain-containing protein [Butyrivibrio sp. X503]
MKNSDLIKQINEILSYLYENAGAMGKDAVREAFLSVYETLNANLLCDENKDTLERLYKEADENILDVDRLRILSMDAIIKYAYSSPDDGVSAEVADSLKQAAAHLEKKSMQLDNLLEYIRQVDHVREKYHLRYPTPSDKFEGKGVVYTVITGDYDEINEPETGDSGLSYVLLTDRERPDYKGKWEIRVIDNPDNLSSVRLSRYPKMFPHIFFPEYDYSVYIDGSLIIKKDIRTFIDTYRRDCGMICFAHFCSESIMDEAVLIVERGKADKAALDTQLEVYKKKGYTAKGYIAELTCIVRDHHDEALKKVMQDWWDEYMSYEHTRDQISFDYVTWKNGYIFDLCDLSVYINPWLEIAKIH